MILQVRTSRPSISMNGTDYYKQLAPYFLTLTYEDNCDGKKADDFELKLADRDKRFINDWMPKRGAYLDVGIIAERWFAPFATAISLDCGRLWIDTVDFQLPEHTVTIKATSIPTGVRLKVAIETRGWEGITLKDLAQKIATENQMDLDYPSDIHNPKYAHIEQHDESALQFLMKRAENAKLGIKVKKNKIFFYDEQKLEDLPPKFALLYGNTAAISGLPAYRMAGGSFTTTVVDKIKKAKVKHLDVTTGDTQQGEAEDPDSDDEDGSTDDQDQNINENTDADTDQGGGGDTRADVPPGEGSAGQWNAADTMKAKAAVREKNKHKYLGRIDLSIGNPLIAAGQTLTVSGVGQYDGKWFLESVKHEVGPEYKSELTIRRCLKNL